MRHAFGERHGRAKLRALEVQEIAEMTRRGSWSLSEIGEIFGVSKATVSDIKHRRTWSHLTDDDGSATPSTNEGVK